MSSKKNIALISKYEFTMNHISKNISHFIHNKIEVYVDESKKGEIVKALKKADVVYIDHLSPLLAKATKKAKVIYVPSHIYDFTCFGTSNEQLSEKEVKKLRKLYSHIDFAIASSDIHTQVLKTELGLEDNQILKIGSVVIDELSGSKFDLMMEEVMQRYPYTLTDFTIIYIPEATTDKQLIEQHITNINQLAAEYGQTSVYYYLGENKACANGTLIDGADINAFLKVANYTITDYSMYLMSALYLNKSVISIKSDNKRLNFDLNKLPLTVCDSISDVIELIKQDDNTAFKEHDLSLFLNYETQSIGRKVVIETLGVKSDA